MTALNRLVSLTEAAIQRVNALPENTSVGAQVTTILTDEIIHLDETTYITVMHMISTVLSDTEQHEELCDSLLSTILDILTRENYYNSTELDHMSEYTTAFVGHLRQALNNPDADITIAWPKDTDDIHATINGKLYVLDNGEDSADRHVWRSVDDEISYIPNLIFEYLNDGCDKPIE